MSSRFPKILTTMIGLLLVVAVPTQASPIKFVDVINVMGDLQGGGQLQQLKLRAALQDPTTKIQTGSTTVATNVTPAIATDPATEILSASTSGPAVPSVLSGIEVAAQQPQTDIQVFQQDSVDGTICDCGEIPVAKGGGIPIWPFFALIPLVCLTGVCFHHHNTPSPTPFCTDCTPTPPPVPEPTSLLLLGSGIVTLTAAARRRYTKMRATKADSSETEGQ